MWSWKIDTQDQILVCINYDQLSVFDLTLIQVGCKIYKNNQLRILMNFVTL